MRMTGPEEIAVVNAAMARVRPAIQPLADCLRTAT